jgi:hypothetical protein
MIEMRRVIDTSEVLGTIAAPVGECEVCATAEASYDADAARLIVVLDAFLRGTDLRAKEKHFKADWLPRNETVTESAGAEEASALARDIFHRWVRRVREASPSLHRP